MLREKLPGRRATGVCGVGRASGEAAALPAADLRLPGQAWWGLGRQSECEGPPSSPAARPQPPAPGLKPASPAPPTCSWAHSSRPAPYPQDWPPLPTFTVRPCVFPCSRSCPSPLGAGQGPFSALRGPRPAALPTGRTVSSAEEEQQQQDGNVLHWGGQGQRSGARLCPHCRELTQEKEAGSGEGAGLAEQRVAGGGAGRGLHRGGVKDQ